MYVYPNTNVKILYNVPLDNSYRNTLYWYNITNQQTYFKGKIKHNVSNCTYQRANSGVIRVGIKAEDLYNCNYLMFQNTSFGDKWFYAFILEINYVNNDVSEIKYEIDVMQTWFFDFTLNQCFVEREHSATDNIGDNILTENFNCSDYTISKTYNDVFTDFNVYLIGYLSTQYLLGDASISKLYDNQFSPSILKCFEATDTGAAALGLKLSDVPSDDIAMVYMFPKKFISRDVSVIYNDTTVVSETGETYIKSFGEPINSTIDGYKPKNNKLFTYPYNFFCADDDIGNTLILPYEDFEDNNPVIAIDTSFMPSPSMRVSPMGFKGSFSRNLNYQLTISGYPQCAYKTSNFTDWLANRALTDTVSGLSSMLSGVAFNATIGNPVGVAVSAVSGISTTIANTVQEHNKPNLNGGSYGNTSVSYAQRDKTFKFYRRCIKHGQAKIIDDYFTMFGYTCNAVKTPNIKSRPHYNYTKTIGCTILGDMPQNDISKIENIFDNGITFWKYPSEVGNYSVNNSPITEE